MGIRIISPFDRNESESQKLEREETERKKGIPKKDKRLHIQVIYSHSVTKKSLKSNENGWLRLSIWLLTNYVLRNLKRTFATITAPMPLFWQPNQYSADQMCRCWRGLPGKSWFWYFITIWIPTVRSRKNWFLISGEKLMCEIHFKHRP